MPNEKIRLLHLSDIHFSRPGPHPEFDLDSDLRNELIRDLERQRPVGAPAFDGIVISGDIAYSGQKDQYSIAIDWLAKVSAAIGSIQEDVFSVPGNHDIDRSVATDMLVQSLHEKIRAADEGERNTILAQMHNAPHVRKVLYGPLDHYTKHFASVFECVIGEEGKSYWEKRLTLNDGWSLVMRGANTTLISGPRDDTDAHKLYMGRHQSLMTRAPKQINMLIAHHPQKWLLDGDAFEHDLQRVHLALLGHTHKHRLQRVQDTVVVSAGALQPHRGETAWEPRYNVIEMTVRPGSPSELEIRIRPRIWSHTQTKFVADVNGHETGLAIYKIPLDDDASPGCSVVSPDGHVVQSETGLAPAAPPPVIPPRTRGVDAMRRLVNRFMRLPFDVKMQIATTLKLVSPEDEELDDLQRINAFLLRAKERALLAELWTAVAAHYTDMTDNPFKTT